jgi:hypothetical protein
MFWAVLFLGIVAYLMTGFILAMHAPLCDDDDERALLITFWGIVAAGAILLLPYFALKLLFGQRGKGV